MNAASYNPTKDEISYLGSLMQQPGYEVLKKIMMGEIDRFQIDLMNVDPSSQTYETEVRAKHALALSAGMFYQRVTDRISGLMQQMTIERDQAQRRIQPDPTENLLDY
jgi:hypothetical protein